MWPDLRSLALAAAIAGLLGFGAGLKVSGWRHDSAALKAKDEAVAAYLHVAGELAGSNDKHLAELKKAQDETNALRDAPARRLYVRANCPASPAAGPVVDTGAGAELDPTARRAYFALRDGIDRTTAQLAACKDELRLRP